LTVKLRTIRNTAVAGVGLALLFTRGAASAEEKALFDFSDSANLKAWTQYFPENPKVPGFKEPAVKIEFAKSGDAADRPCLKITYAGGKLPAIATRCPLEDLTPFKSFRAVVIAPRTCVAAFRVVGLDDKGHGGWVKIARLDKGRNVVIEQAPSRVTAIQKTATQFEVLMYNPHAGETLLVESVHLSTEEPKETTRFRVETNAMPGETTGAYGGRFFPKLGTLRVLGLDEGVSKPSELAKRMADKWVKPVDQTVEQVEADFEARYQRLKKDHPRAILAVLRNGQKGYDPAAPEKAYEGWVCTGTNVHGPAYMLLETVKSQDGSSAIMFPNLRGRPALSRVDLTSIPRDSAILAAQLVLVRSYPLVKDWDSKHTFFVAECCNRPWQATEVNTFEYAKDHFWKEPMGCSWDGDDPDFLPMLIAYGPSQGTANFWDFTEAVKWWTEGEGEGKHPNHGFTLYNSPGPAADWLGVYTQRAKEVRQRPAKLVIYEPKP
jgi:hypothetical protein